MKKFFLLLIILLLICPSTILAQEAAGQLEIQYVKGEVVDIIEETIKGENIKGFPTGSQEIKVKIIMAPTKDSYSRLRIRFQVIPPMIIG